MKTFVLDTETGGLSPYTDGLASISIKELDKNNSKTWFIKPKQNKFYAYRALQINKLDLETLENIGHKLQTVMDDLILNWLNEKTVRIIGHNIEFDLKFLIQAAKENNIKLPTIEYVCTMDLAKIHLKQTKILKTIKLVEVFEYFFPGDDLLLRAHESEADVLMTEAIFKELWKLENDTT